MRKNQTSAPFDIQQRREKNSHEGWIGTGLGTQPMAVGQFHLDGGTRRTLVTGR
ncbi:hypothetical protein [Methylobacterium sp. D54C]